MKPIRVGIVGLGRAGMGMHCYELDRFPDRFVVVAACDLLEDRCDNLKKRYGCATYLKIEDMLADPAVELVDVCTRTVDHVAHALMGLKAGKTVFLEKPPAVSFTEAKKLKAAAAAHPGKLFIRHNRRFEAAFQHIREIIKSGILGEVFEIKIRRNSYSRRDDWQTLMSCGGGQLLNWGPHIIDHALLFLESPVDEVWSDIKRIAAVGDAEDHIKIVMRGKTGRVVDLEISGGAALGGEPVYTVYGRKGALTCDDQSIKLRYLEPGRKLPPRHAKPGTPDGGFGSPDDLHWIEETIPVGPELKCDTLSIWQYLHDSIRNRMAFPITLEQALEVMRVISLVKKGTKFED